MEKDLKALLTKLTGIQDPLRRHLLAAAVVSEAVGRECKRPILVGGQALEFYTFGEYVTGDLDFVSGCPNEVLERVMNELGFSKTGNLRQWIYPETNILIEFPGRNLEGREDKITEVVIEGYKLQLIGIEDLLLDRLSAYVFWKSKEDAEWSVNLISLYAGDLDWTYLEEKALEKGLEKALTECKAAGLKIKENE